MLPVLQLGPIAIQTPGLILILSLWLGLNLAEKHAPRQNISPDVIYNLAFIALVAGVIGARVLYAIQYASAFIASPASLISLNPGLLDPFGGVATGLIAALIYGQRKHLALLPTLDALAPLLMMMAVAIPFANLTSGNGFGSETDLLWGIELWGAKRHPAQIYECLAAIGILVLLWPGKGALARRVSNPGMIFMVFLALSAGTRLFLEAFRGDSVTLSNGWRSAQILAWLILAGSFWGIERIRKANQPINHLTH